MNYTGQNVKCYTNCKELVEKLLMFSNIETLDIVTTLC